MQIEVDESKRFVLVQDNGDGTTTITRNVPGQPMTKHVFLAPFGELPIDPVSPDEVDRLRSIKVDVPNEPG